MSLPGSELRHRRTTLRELVTNLDAFTKTTENIKEEKKTSGGIVSGVCFIIIFALISGELRAFFFGDSEYEYKFTVDVAYDEHPELELDIIVATPCSNLDLQVTGNIPNEFGLLHQFKKDPTRFEFTKRELMLWNELKKANERVKPGGTVFKGLERMAFVSGKVEDGLVAEAEKKQKEEAEAIEQERKKNPREETQGNAVLLIGNGMNVFHIIASNSQKDEGTACRVHGRVRVNKVRGDSVVIVVGKGFAIDGIFAHVDGVLGLRNTSHRIERLNFGPRISGLVTPLAGTEQFSESGSDEFHYFLKVVPTRISRNGLFGGSTLTYQYSVTFTKKSSKSGSHAHAAIAIHYEFAATVIEVQQIQTSILQLLVRLCSIAGGVFATSAILNSVFANIICLWVQQDEDGNRKVLMPHRVRSLSSS